MAALKIWNGSAWVEIAGSGVADHGNLSGLTADGHTHYLLNDGTRSFTGTLLPSADLTHDFGSPSFQLNNIYGGKLFLTQALHSGITSAINRINQTIRHLNNENLTIRTDLNEFADEFQDESGVDTANSTGAYDPSGDFFFFGDNLIVEESFTTFVHVSLGVQTLGNSSGYRDKVAQSFKIGTSQTDIKAIEMYFGRAGTPGDITVRIETDSSGDPSGTLAHANLTTTITEASVGVPAWVRATFSSVGSLTSGTTYWIVLSLASDPGGPVDVYSPWGDNTDNYADGNFTSHTDGGAWATGTLNDAAFKIMRDDVLTANNVLSNAKTASSQPEEILMVAWADLGSGGAIAYSVSRDGGTTFTAVTMTEIATESGSIKSYYGRADVSAQPAGTSVVLKAAISGTLEEAKLYGWGTQYGDIFGGVSSTGTAPNDAQYYVASADGDLSAEIVLSATAPIALSAGDVSLTNFADNQKLLFGTGSDSSILYDGGNIIINAQEVGGGNLQVTGDVQPTSGNVFNLGVAAGPLWEAVYARKADFTTGSKQCTFGITANTAEFRDGSTVVLLGTGTYAARIDGTVIIKEQAAAAVDLAAYGQIWVKTATPNQLFFTDDAGTDAQVVLAGGAFHDGFSDFVAAEHVSLPATIAAVLTDHDLAAHTSLGLFDASSDVDHDATTNFVLDEHLDWTADQGAKNIDNGNVVATYSTITGNDGGTDVTAAELEELSDGSTTTLHDHAGGGASLTYSNAEVFSGTSPTSWTNLDLSATVGSNRAFVSLKFNSSADMNAVAVRTDGDTDEFHTATADASAYGNQLGHHDNVATLVLSVWTSVTGIIEWQTETARTATVDVQGYIA